jgi:hypothetical protein
MTEQMPPTDPMFLDLAAAFAEGDDDTKELALISLETIVRDRVHLKRRVTFLESVAGLVADKVLAWFTGPGLYGRYYEHDKYINDDDIALLDSFSRDSIALRVVHEKLNSRSAKHPTDEPKPKPQGILLLAASIMIAGVALALFAKANHERNTAAARADAATARANAAEYQRVALASESEAKSLKIAELQKRQSLIEERSKLQMRLVASKDDSTKFRKLVLRFTDVSPAVISKIDICKNFVENSTNQFETIYYWRWQDPPSEYVMSYLHQPDQPPGPITTLVRYYPADKGDPIDRRIDLDSSPQGVAFRAIPNVKDLVAKADPATDAGQVRLELTGTPVGDALTAATTLHVVVQPRNGRGLWSGANAKCFISNTGITLAEIGKTPLETRFDLRQIGVLEREEEPFPNDYDVLVVALPVNPLQSEITASELEPYKPRILAQTKVHWANPPLFVN